MTPTHAALPARAGVSRLRHFFFLAVKPENSEELLRVNRRGYRSGIAVSWGRSLAAVALLVGAGVAILRTASTQPIVGRLTPAAQTPVFLPQGFRSANQSAGMSATTSAEARSAYGRLPLVFEANLGQSDASVKFLARGNGYGLFLTGQEAVLVSQRAVSNSRFANAASVVSMKLAHANPTPEVTASDELPGKSNYLIGSDPAKWHRNVPQFARVRYRNVYPGIDLLYYGNQGRLEYDFEVAPGADPKLVSLLVKNSAEEGLGEAGSSKLRLNDAGDLLLPTSAGEVRFAAPHVYQRIGAEEKPVVGRFVLRADNQVGFELGAYDRSRALVIDPVLSYSTYLGGSGAESCSAILGVGPTASTPGCPAIAVDSASNAYIAGATTSTVNFPNPAGAASTNTVNGPADIFITKLDNTGTAQLFTTYLGGSGTDTAAGISVDSGFDVVVAGTTNSVDFPHTPGAYQASPESAGHNHVFVTKLDPTGSSQIYSSYLSGNGNDIATGVALDLQGKIYVTGTTTSTDAPSASVEFPATVGGFQPNSRAANQFFMTKVDPASNGSGSVPYSTYFGGGNPANGVAIGGGIAVDSNGNVFITGGTNFVHVGVANDFPILNAMQSCLDLPEAVAPATAVTCTANAATDAFVAKISPTAASGAQLQYSTFVGGTGADVAYGIALDSSGDAYITGSTTSTDFALPTGTVPFQAGNSGGMDAFVAKISNFTPPATTSTTATAVSLVYFSYLGGSGNDTATGIAVDSVQGARITGWTDSANFPTQNAVEAAPGGGREAFVANLDTTASVACTPNPSANPPVHCASYASFLGGSGTDMGTDIAVDSQGASYVAGETASNTGFPLLTPLQAALAGPSDAFVTRFSPDVKLSMTATASPSPVGVGGQVTFTYTITNLRDVATGVTFTDNFAVTSPNATFVSATASPGSCGTQVTGGSVQCNLGNLNTTATGASAATVTIILTPTPSTTTTPQVPPPLPPPLGNSGTVSVAGTTFQASATASATVNDFAISVAPASQTVAAGGFATYTITLTPTGGIPGAVNLTAGSALPTGVTSAFSTNPLPNLNNGPVTSVLNINTTARVTTTVQLQRHGGPFYAGWLPISGLALVGAGIGGRLSRKRGWALGLLLGAFFTLILLQPACGTTAVTTTTTGTPAGTYTVTVSAASGSATRTTTVQLVVQ